jgi:diguanylate cyclase (GGDEF)-like protein
MTRLLKWCDHRLSTLHPMLLNVSAVMVTLSLVALDLSTAPFVSLVLFYALCIGICAWYSGLRWATICGALSTIGWLGDVATGASPLPLALWNALLRAVTIVVFLYLVVRLRASLAQAEYLAQHDPLTGALNARALHAQLRLHQQRALHNGQPLSLAYLDLDDFKQINDRHGHTIGDRVLVTLVSALQSEFRTGECVVRMGGDEFALLLPNVTATQAPERMERLRSAVAASLQHHDWPITLSVGVVTFLTAPVCVDDMLREADQLMYVVKQAGKNAAHFAVYPMVAQGATEAGRSRRSAETAACNRPPGAAGPARTPAGPSVAR